MAERFPKSRITSVSNSNNQRVSYLVRAYSAAPGYAYSSSNIPQEFIEAKAKERGFKNLKVITCDMTTFKPPDGAFFDRVNSLSLLFIQ
jgi:hypothetical protein